MSEFEKTEDKKVEDKKVEDKKVEDKKVEDKKVEEFIRLKAADGEIHHLTPEEVLQLATYGINKYKEEKTGGDKKESKKSVDSDEDEEDAVRKDVNTIKAEREEEKRQRKQEQELNVINSLLDTLTQANEATKNNPKLAKKIRNLTLTSMNMNPRQDMSKVFKEELEDYLAMVPKKEKEESSANKTVRRSLISTIRGGAGPLIDASKKFTPNDVKTNTSRTEMKKFLERASSGD